MLKNEFGIAGIYLPIFFVNLVFLGICIYYYELRLEKEYEYNINLVTKNSIIFLGLIFCYNIIQRHISPHLLFFIYMLFNIMIVLSDIYNVKEFEMHNINNNSSFYRIYQYKNYVNYVIIFYLVSFLLINCKTWYKIYRRSDAQTISENINHQHID